MLSRTSIKHLINLGAVDPGEVLLWPKMLCIHLTLAEPLHLCLSCEVSSDIITLNRTRAVLNCYGSLW